MKKILSYLFRILPIFAVITNAFADWNIQQAFDSSMALNSLGANGKVLVLDVDGEAYSGLGYKEKESMNVLSLSVWNKDHLKQMYDQILASDIPVLVLSTQERKLKDIQEILKTDPRIKEDSIHFYQVENSFKDSASDCSKNSYLSSLGNMVYKITDTMREHPKKTASLVIGTIIIAGVVYYYYKNSESNPSLSREDQMIKDTKSVDLYQHKHCPCKGLNKGSGCYQTDFAQPNGQKYIDLEPKLSAKGQEWSQSVRVGLKEHYAKIVSEVQKKVALGLLTPEEACQIQSQANISYHEELYKNTDFTHRTSFTDKLLLGKEALPSLKDPRILSSVCVITKNTAVDMAHDSLQEAMSGIACHHGMGGLK